MTLPGRPSRPDVDQTFLARLATTTVAAAMARTSVPTLRPGTVVASEDGTTVVRLDGDDGTVLATALTPEPGDGDRIMVLLAPPSGAFVVGFLGASRDTWGTGGGGGGATEVLVDPAQPASRGELLLWVDTDAVPASGTWQALSLVPPYAPYAGWQTPQWRQLGDVVEVRGLVAANGATAGATICVLPAPPNSIIQTGSADVVGYPNGTPVRLDIHGGTGATNAAVGTFTYVSLSSIRYSVA